MTTFLTMHSHGARGNAEVGYTLTMGVIGRAAMCTEAERVSPDPDPSMRNVPGSSPGAPLITPPPGLWPLPHLGPV